MTFRLASYGSAAMCGQRCPEVISAEGEITNDTPRAFLAFVAHNLDDGRMRSVVFLHSPGGGVAASMRLGEIFRKMKVLAIVARMLPARGATMPLADARCFSACVYALMGAKKRVVPPSSLVGIHRMFFYDYSRDPLTGEETARRTLGTKDFVAKLSDYARSMGVSRDLVRTAETIDPDHVHIVTPRELRRWRLGSQKF
jgi:hypothetical protein